MANDDDLQANIDRTVGFSALRRMAKLASDRDATGDAERATKLAQPDAERQANIERTVGFSAVRRMSKLAAEINDDTRRGQRAGRRLLIGVGVVLLILIVVLVVEPEVITGFLRRMTGD